MVILEEHGQRVENWPNHVRGVLGIVCRGLHIEDIRFMWRSIPYLRKDPINTILIIELLNKDAE